MCSSDLGIVRSNRQWNVGAISLTFAPTGVVNAASFTPDLSPGALFSIFGVGFAKPGTTTTVQVGGKTANIIAALPFQLNAQVPPDAVPGTSTLTVTSGNGTTQQPVVIKSTSPAIFSIGTQAAITNQNNSLNSPSNPALRGSTIVIYATGLGTTGRVGQLSPASTAATAVINGTELPSAFAGLTPGFIGLYQVNVSIPANFPPGLTLPLTIKQGTTSSNSVSVAIQ